MGALVRSFKICGLPTTKPISASSSLVNSQSALAAENVEGLVKHDLENKYDVIGRTLKTILDKLENELDYQVSWKVLDSVNFGVPQSRKRVFIVGTKNEKVSLDNFEPTYKVLNDVLESGKPIMKTDFTKKFPLIDRYIDSLMKE